MSKRRFNVERSREIRQWLMLFRNFISTGIILDVVLNDGNTITKLVNTTKIKIAAIKSKFKKKEQEQTVDNYINF